MGLVATNPRFEGKGGCLRSEGTHQTLLPHTGGKGDKGERNRLFEEEATESTNMKLGKYFQMSMASGNKRLSKRSSIHQASCKYSSRGAEISIRRKEPPRVRAKGS